jgi:hypothetical protein
MQTRYHDIADVMESKAGLSPACVAAETDWRQCIFSQYSLKHTSTPTFVINSLYNFGEWRGCYNGSEWRGVTTGLSGGVLQRV